MLCEKSVTVSAKNEVTLPSFSHLSTAHIIKVFIPRYLEDSARFASEQGVVSYAVGVGPHYDLKELRTIAGNDERVFEVARFNGLDEIVNGLQQSIAQSLEGIVVI